MSMLRTDGEMFSLFHNPTNLSGVTATRAGDAVTSPGAVKRRRSGLGEIIDLAWCGLIERRARVSFLKIPAPLATVCAFSRVSCLQGVRIARIMSDA